MRKKVVIFSITILIILLFGFYYLNESKNTNNLNANDVNVSGYISYFGKASQLETYLNIDLTYKSEKEITKLRENTIKVNFTWELVPEKQLESYQQNELYYPPYLVIIQPGNWDYLGTGPRQSSIASVGSLPGEVYENVLKGNPDYDWENINEKGLIKVIQPKSFAQEIANIAYSKRTNENVSKEFKGYFIYYNPVSKTGWVKQLSF